MFYILCGEGCINIYEQTLIQARETRSRISLRVTQNGHSSLVPQVPRFASETANGRSSLTYNANYILPINYFPHKILAVFAIGCWFCTTSYKPTGYVSH